MTIHNRAKDGNGARYRLAKPERNQGMKAKRREDASHHAQHRCACAAAARKTRDRRTDNMRDILTF
jgi:hypothetical protein